MPRAVHMPGGSSGNAFDILLRFLLDKETYQEVINGTKTMGVALNGLGDAEGGLAETAEKLQGALDEQEKKVARLQVAWWRAQRELRAAQFVMTAIAGTGAAIVTPLVAAANNWAQQMEKANVQGDEVYTRWKATMQVLDAAKLSFGRTAAEALLPTMEKLAELADKASKFAAAHPDIIEAGFKTGAALVAIGTLGTLLVQGIKLVVDVKFVLASTTNMAAAELMQIAAKNNLAAAVAMNTGAKVTATTVPMTAAGGLTVILTKLGAVLGPLLVIAAALSAGAYGGVKSGNYWGQRIYGDQWKEQSFTEGLASAWRSFRELVLVDLTMFIDFAQKFRNALVAAIGYVVDTLAQTGKELWDALFPSNSSLQMVEAGFKKIKADWDAIGQAFRAPSSDFTKSFFDLGKSILGLKDAADKATPSIVDTAAAIAQAQKEADAAKITAKLTKDLKDQEYKYNQDRLKIVEDGIKSVQKADQDLQKTLGQIGVDLARKLAGIDASHQVEASRAEEDFQIRRKEIVKTSNVDLEKLARDHQKRLEELEREHNFTMYDLAQARDALGLVKEQRRYAQARADEDANFRQQQVEKRTQTRQELVDLRQKFLLERQRRNEDWQRQRAEAQAQAVIATAEAKTRHDEEIAQIREQTRERLQELEQSYQEERRRRIQQAWQDIQDLGGALKAEADFKHKYYQYMLTDVQDFVTKYKTALDKLYGSTPSGVPSRQAGGYIPTTGLYRLHAGEFVATPATVRAGERLVGSRLSQMSLLGMIGGLRGALTYNDYRVYDTRLRAEDRRQINQDTFDAISAAMAGA